MKVLISFCIVFTVYNTAYSQKVHVEKLQPQNFYERLTKDSATIPIDLRIPTQYVNGLLVNTPDIDLKSIDCSNKVSKLDKYSRIDLYCLSGGRSSEAVGILSELGLKSILKLDDVMMAWHSRGLSEVKDTVISISIGREPFLKMLKSEKFGQ